jgi:hypothetical protein
MKTNNLTDDREVGRVIMDARKGVIESHDGKRRATFSNSVQEGLTEQEANFLMERYKKNGCTPQKRLCHETGYWSVSVVLREDFNLARSQMGTYKFKLFVGGSAKG